MTSARQTGRETYTGSGADMLATVELVRWWAMESTRCCGVESEVAELEREFSVEGEDVMRGLEW